MLAMADAKPPRQNDHTKAPPRATKRRGAHLRVEYLVLVRIILRLVQPLADLVELAARGVRLQPARALAACRTQRNRDPQQQSTRGLPENARHRGPLSNRQHSRAVREKTSAQGYAHRERSKTVMPSASAWYGSAPKSSSVSTVLKVVWFTMGMTAIISGVCARATAAPKQL